MPRMSTRWRSPCTGARCGWLLLLGGLGGCKTDAPGVLGLKGSALVSEPDTELDGGLGADDLSLGDGAITERFVRVNAGSAYAVQALDLDGDGVPEVIYGGNSVVVLGQDHAEKWSFVLPQNPAPETMDPLNQPEATDPGLPAALRMAKARAFLGIHVRAIQVLSAVEGADLLVLDNQGRVFRLDGRLGTPLWTTEVEGGANACGFASFAAGEDTAGGFFPSGGRTAYSSTTGAPVWQVDIGFSPGIVRSGELNGRPGADLLLARGEEQSLLNYPGFCAPEVAVLHAMRLLGADMPDPATAGHATPSRAEPFPRIGWPPAVYAFDGSGVEIWRGPATSESMHAVVVTDRDDDGMDEVVVGYERSLRGLDANGAEVWRRAIQGTPSDLVALDVDRDGKPEIFANGTGQRRSTLYAFSGEGQPLWNLPLDGRAVGLDGVELTGGGGPELLVRTSVRLRSDPLDGDPLDGEPLLTNPWIPPATVGRAATLAYTPTIGGAPTELWRFETDLPVRAYATITDIAAGTRDTDFRGQDSAQLLLAGAEARLYTLDGNSGAPLSDWVAGGLNHAIGAGDLDGDGADEVIAGDVFGNLTTTGGDGRRGLDLRLHGDGPAVVMGLNLVDLEGHGEMSIVASGFAWHGAQAGVLERFDAAGESVFSVRTKEGMSPVALADLDGDGAAELVVATFSWRPGARPPVTPRPSEDPSEILGTCGVRAFNAEGVDLWYTPIADCQFASLTVGDTNGDGIDEVAYADLGADGPHHVALLDGEGAVLWDVASAGDDAFWLHLVPEGVVFGGRSADAGGHVTLLSATSGDALWRYAIAPTQDPATLLEWTPIGPISGSLAGTPTADLDEDGQADLAFTTVGGDLIVVGAADGVALWRADLGYALAQTSSGPVGGPLAYLPSEGGKAGALVVTGLDLGTFASTVQVYSLDGEALGQIALAGPVHTIALPAWSAIQTGAAFDAGLSVYGIDVDPGRVQPRPGRPVPQE